MIEAVRHAAVALSAEPQVYSRELRNCIYFGNGSMEGLVAF
jgi:hypothetical protein